MKIHQLFRDKVPDDLLDRIVKCYGLKSLDDQSSFSKDDIERQGIVAHFSKLVEELRRYYLPCKARLYLDDLGPHSSSSSSNLQPYITVLRQVARLSGKSLKSSQRYINNRKITFYFLTDNHDSIRNIKLTSEMVHVDFA